MIEMIYFARVRESAIIPSKDLENAGYDVYANFEEENLVIEPFTSVLVPTGIASSFNNESAMVFFERGSTGIKNMKKSAGVIDSNFRGEWKVLLYNANVKPLVITKETNKETLKILEEDFVVYPYSKAICQALLLPVPKTGIRVISLEELQNIPSDRGTGMLGSSNK